jgi:hypothetical protein
MIDDGRAPLSTARPHGIRLLRLRLHGADRTYDVDFRTAAGTPRPLSVIAGAFSTGKTTVLEFIDYCLGASDHPRHPEIMPKVRAATLEIELSGTPYLIERAVGEPSTFAYVRPGQLDSDSDQPLSIPERRPLRPAGNPDSLSGLLLAHCKLDGVRLRDLPAQSDSDTDPLSFRDLMWLCFLPNERLDNRNLLFENHPMKHLRLQQVVDVVFGVHDDRSVDLGRRVRQVDAELAEAQAEYAVASRIVHEQQVGRRTDLEAAHQRAKAELADTELAVAALDEQTRAATGFAEELRERHRNASLDARRASAVLRDRETQVQRMGPLRAQYADDVSKLTMLIEAHRLLDSRRPEVQAPESPSLLDSRRPEVQAPESPSLFDPVPTAAPEGPAGPAGTAGDPATPVDAAAELRAAKARLAELTGYLEELERDLPDLREKLERAQEAESRAAAEVDSATAHAVTPYLAQRDALARRREDAVAAIQRAVSGLRLVQSLERRADHVARQESLARSLREELATETSDRLRPDRAAVIARVSERYRQILADWRYPKLAGAYLADDLTPFVRGDPYQAASAGGRTLIALAWQLAMFEVAWETGSSHPGFLMLDSPQKNLGRAAERDAEFADSVTVADIYRHLHAWLTGPGAGAQIVVADNVPPEMAEPDVIVRFSRRPDQPPYGLIDDETS